MLLDNKDDDAVDNVSKSLSSVDTYAELKDLHEEIENCDSSDEDEVVEQKEKKITSAVNLEHLKLFLQTVDIATVKRLYRTCVE